MNGKDHQASKEYLNDQNHEGLTRLHHEQIKYDASMVVFWKTLMTFLFEMFGFMLLVPASMYYAPALKNSEKIFMGEEF